MWEYVTENIKAKTSFMGGKFDEEELEEILDEYGAESWELVNIVPLNIDRGSTARLLAVFKRPCSSNEQKK